jgi:hypothetical protein
MLAMAGALEELVVDARLDDVDGILGVGRCGNASDRGRIAVTPEVHVVVFREAGPVLGELVFAAAEEIAVRQEIVTRSPP